jgi:hypothetical protein
MGWSGVGATQLIPEGFEIESQLREIPEGFELESSIGVVPEGFSVEKKPEVKEVPKKSFASNFIDPITGTPLGTPIIDYKALKSIGRMAKTAGSAALAEPTAGIGGLVELAVTQDLEKAKKEIEAIREEITIPLEDATPEEAAIMGGLAKPFEWLEEKGEDLGEWSVEKGAPDWVGASLQTLVEGAPEVAALLAPTVVKHIPKIKSKVPIQRAKTAKQLEVSPETKFLKSEFQKEFLDSPLINKAATQGKPIPKEVKSIIGTTELRAGVPVHKVGQIWENTIGTLIWDKAVMQGIPRMLEKVPGGKAVNRAFIYEYRGDLPQAAKYVRTLDKSKSNVALGQEYGTDLGRRLQALPQDAQLRVADVIRGGETKLKGVEARLATESKEALYNLGKQSVDLGLMTEETFFKNAGRYMPRLYTSKEYGSLLKRFGLGKPNRLDLSRFKRRKDIPKEIRQEMGEILTPGYPVAKGVAQLTHDIEMSRFFNGIAANEKWAATARAEIIPEGFKQLPSNKKLGNLSEAHVHPEIYNELMEAVRVPSVAEKNWRRALGAWKFGKVILSPKTHARNLMSNSVLAHLGGLPMWEQPVYLTKAARQMKGKGEYWLAAKKEGLLQHTFTNSELRTLFDEIEINMSGIKADSLPEKFGVIGDAWEKSKQGARGAAKIYEAEEQVYKMAKFIHNVDRKGMNPGVAAIDAEKWLFNYQKLTPFQEKFRSKWYGAPFATFTFKAMPRIMEAAVKTPWRFATPAAVIYALEQAAMGKFGDTSEEFKAKKKLRPDWMRGNFLGIPNFARTPMVDEHGREYYLNLTYILPWGDIGEGGGFGPIPGSLVPFTQPFVKEGWQQIANFDNFWKEAIVPETELAGKSKMGKLKTQAELRARHAVKTMAPTPVIDIVKGYQKYKGRPDYRGRERKATAVALDVFTGIKLYPVDYVDQLAQQVKGKQQALAGRIKGQIKSYAIKKNALQKKGKSTKFYDKKIKQKIEQLKGLAEESRGAGKTAKKARIIK